VNDEPDIFEITLQISAESACQKSGKATFLRICAPSLVGRKTCLPAVPTRKEAILQAKSHEN